MDDEAFVKASWALDVEWEPTRCVGVDNPVATLQLATLEHAFVVDVQSLCRTNQIPDTPMDQIEMILSDVLKELFEHNDIPVLGLGINHDLEKLCASFPHMPCFRQFNCVVNLVTVSRRVYPQTRKHYMSGVQKMVAILLKRQLDKTEQCSTWGIRPLTEAQIEYAALDAAVLPRLLSMMMNEPDFVKKYSRKFFLADRQIKMSSRHMIMGCLADTSDLRRKYRIKNGSVKRLLGVIIAKQAWHSHKKAPLPLDYNEVTDSCSLDQEPPMKRKRSTLGTKEKPKQKLLKYNDDQFVPPILVLPASFPHFFSGCDTHPDFTNFVRGFQETLDYVLASKPAGSASIGFTLVETAPMPSRDVVVPYIAMPNGHMPSDHVSVVCDLKFEENRDRERSGTEKEDLDGIITSTLVSSEDQPIPMQPFSLQSINDYE